MANTKISALDAVATPASTDEFAVNQGGTTKKQTRAQIHTLESGETLDTTAGAMTCGNISVESTSPIITLKDTNNVLGDVAYQSYIRGRDSANAQAWWLGDGGSSVKQASFWVAAGYALGFYSNGTLVLMLSDSSTLATFSGAVGMGALTATTASLSGQIASTASGGVLVRVGTSTSQQYIELANTSGDAYFGVESSSNGGFFTGSTAYNTVIYSPSKNFQIITGGVAELTVASGGVTVASDLTVSGTVTQSTVTTLADDGTPTVAASNLFLTGGVTTITDFDDGVVGQTITILAAHSIKITDGAPIILAGGVDYDMTDSDTLVLTMFNDQVWNEVSRSVN